MRYVYIEFPPFSGDPIRLLSPMEWAESDLPANHRYRLVTVNDGSDGRPVGDYPTMDSLLAYVIATNESRIYSGE